MHVQFRENRYFEMSTATNNLIRVSALNANLSAIKCIKCQGHQSFMEPVVGEIWHEFFLRRNLACGTHLALEYFVCLRQESSKLIGSLKRTEIDRGDAKIDRGDAKNVADKSTKITIGKH